MANILVFGDSISYGFYDEKGGWVDRLKITLLELSRKEKLPHDLKVYNLGISGDTTDDLLEHFECEVKPRDWESQETIIIFAFGVNDSIIIDGNQKVPQKRFSDNVSTLIKTARKYSDKILFVGPIPVGEAKVSPMPWSTIEYCKNEKISEYNNILKNLCKDNKLTFLDMFGRWKKLDYESLLDDGLHPNTKGHERIYEIVKKYLKEGGYF